MRGRMSWVWIIGVGGVLVAVVGLALLITGGPAPLAIALHLAPESRQAGFARAPAGSPFTQATVTVDTSSSYSGGHGSGTRFYDISANLELARASGPPVRLSLQHAGLPGRDGVDFTSLLLAGFRLRFSDDGQRLALSRDGRHWNVLFLDTHGAPLFCRHLMFDATEHTVFDRAPAPHALVLDSLLGNAPDAPLQLHTQDASKSFLHSEPWPPSDEYDHAEWDGVTAWLASHPEDLPLQRVLLAKLLSLPNNIVIDFFAGRIAVAGKFVTGRPELVPELEAKVRAADLRDPAPARMAARLLLAAKDPTLLDALDVAIARLVAAPSSEWREGAPADDKQWTFNDLVWIAGAALEGRPPSAALTDALLKLIAIPLEGMPYGVRRAKIHAVRMLERSQDPRVTPALERVAGVRRAEDAQARPSTSAAHAADASASASDSHPDLPPWPTEWKDPVRDQEEDLLLRPSSWAKVALERRAQGL